MGGVSPYPEGSLNLAGFDEDSAENIRENRRRFLSALGAKHELATGWQVHGDKIRTVDGPAASDAEKCDALISDRAGILLGVKTADCVPILIGDATTGAFAAVHAGWRGTVRAIAAKAVRMLRDTYGSRAGNLVCAIGPAAGGSRYEVGPEVIAALAEAFSDPRPYLVPTREGHATADLKGANRDQLLAEGVPADQVYLVPFCTMERTDLFFSYRIEKSRLGRTGRMLSVIGRSDHLNDA